MLESDCLQIRRYVSFREGNFNTCSDEIIRQLISVGAEIDHILKEICSVQSDEGNMKIYKNWLLENIGQNYLNNITLNIQESQIMLKPFSPIRNKDSRIEWWSAYNSVKHNRWANYEKGSLYNLLHAMAALYFLECFQIKKIADKYSDDENLLVFDVPPNSSKMLSLLNFKTRFNVTADGLFFETA